MSKDMHFLLAAKAGVSKVIKSNQATGVPFSSCCCKNYTCDRFVSPPPSPKLSQGADFSSRLHWLAALHLLQGNDLQKTKPLGRTEGQGFQSPYRSGLSPGWLLSRYLCRDFFILQENRLKCYESSLRNTYSKHALCVGTALVTKHLAAATVQVKQGWILHYWRVSFCWIILLPDYSPGDLVSSVWVKMWCWSQGGIGGESSSWKGWREKRGPWWWDTPVCLTLIWLASQHFLSPVLCLIPWVGGWIRRSSEMMGRLFLSFPLGYLLPKLLPWSGPLHDSVKGRVGRHSNVGKSRAECA